MIRFALAPVGLVLALLLAPHAGAQTAARPKPIAGDWISLGDVAPVTGDAAGILIGPAPPPGQTLALDPAFVASVARKAGVFLAISLEEPIWVTRAKGNAPTAKVANPARPATPAPQIGAPAATDAQVLVLIRDVARGQRLTDADLGWADPATTRTVRNGPTSMDVAIGLETKRPLKAGQPLQMSDVKTPALIKKGQAVKLVYVSPGLRLTVDGQAQADAGKGETVRVLNTYSKRTVDAEAFAEGEARVLQR